MNEYGDFVVQVDWTVGQVLKAVDDAGITDDTLVIYTSDNGSYMYRYDDPAQEDHVDNASVQGYQAENHRANGPFRGTKADIWEAGHHVPLLVRWPGHVRAGSTCASTVCLTDLYATCAEIVGAELSAQEAEDSLSLLAMLGGKKTDRAHPSFIIRPMGCLPFVTASGSWSWAMVLADARIREASRLVSRINCMTCHPTSEKRQTWRSSTLRLSRNGHPSLIQFASGDGVGNLACLALRLCKRDRIGRTGPPVQAVFWKKKVSSPV